MINRLRASHESSPLIFQMLHLEPLAPTERIDVVRKGLTQIKDKTGVEVKMEPQAETFISALSEGYPHFIQQFAYSACESDTDNEITFEDVIAGALGEHGALQQLGLKYFHELYFEKIFSDEYRAVLRFLAQHSSEWSAKENIRKALTIKETTLNNALTTLKKRHIILSQDGHKGMYKLPTESFAAWIRAYTKGLDAETQLNQQLRQLRLRSRERMPGKGFEPSRRNIAERSQTARVSQVSPPRHCFGVAERR